MSITRSGRLSRVRHTKQGGKVSLVEALSLEEVQKVRGWSVDIRKQASWRTVIRAGVLTPNPGLDSWSARASDDGMITSKDYEHN